MTKHIVVIDDEDDLRAVIKAALVKYARWQVSTAATALEGLKLVQNQPPDLVLLDISMPAIAASLPRWVSPGSLPNPSTPSPCGSKSKKSSGVSLNLTHQAVEKIQYGFVKVVI